MKNLLVWLLLSVLPVVASAQVKNTVTEVKDYRVKDGKDYFGNGSEWRDCRFRVGFGGT